MSLIESQSVTEAKFTSDPCGGNSPPITKPSFSLAKMTEDLPGGEVRG